jgi:hypothetical protein
MPTRPAIDEADLVPAADPARTDYDRDFYSWSLEQARLIRQEQWHAVDRENVAEEIESLGREQFNKLESALRVLMMHILKWDHQPEKRSRSWATSIKDQRVAFQDVLDDNPALKSRLDEAIMRAYRRARLQASLETGLAEDVFPERCPYRLDDLTTRVFEH